jgi:hypothetical protein
MLYIVRPADIQPEMQGAWNSPAWQQADTLGIAHFRPESSDHRPRTYARLLYAKEGLFGIFRVEDRYVRCVRTHYLDAVYKDSCVEFFVRPKADRGYFNFEFNCGGSLLCYYIVDPTRASKGFRDFTPFPEVDGNQVAIYHSMPQMVEPEIAVPTEWLLEFFIPFALLEKYVGVIGHVHNQEWRANFYKCADDTSHPHWASWSPVDELNFHLPDCFGAIRFDDKPEEFRA